MQEFDSFSNQLQDEAKRYLEKAKEIQYDNHDALEAFLHASLLLSMCALEAYVNAMSSELLSPPCQNSYPVHEQALLLERDVKFEKGEYVVGNNLKMYRLIDRIEYLYFKFSGRKIGADDTWYINLKQSIDTRNKLVHPKTNITLTITQVENTLCSILDTVNVLYGVIYKTGLPSYSMGLQSKYSF